MTTPVKPAAGETCTPRASGLIAITASPPVGLIAVTSRTSPFGSVSLASTSTSIGRSTRVWVWSSRATGGRFGPSSSILSDSTISAFGSSGLISSITSPPSFSVLFSSESSADWARIAPQSSTRSRRRWGLVTQAAPVSTSLTHTQPLTSRRRSSEPAPSSGLDSTCLSPHHWLYDGCGAVDTANTHPPRTSGATGEPPASWPISVLSTRSPSRTESGIAKRRPSAVAATTWSVCSPGCCRINGAGRPSGSVTPVSSGVIRSGVATKTSPSGSASTAVSSPRKVSETASSVRLSFGLVSVEPSGRRKMTLSAPWSTITAWPSGVAAERAEPSPRRIGSTSSRVSSEAISSRLSRHTLIESRLTTSAPPSTAWTATSGSTCSVSSTVSVRSSTSPRVPAVRSWTAMTPFAWSTS